MAGFPIGRARGFDDDGSSKTPPPFCPKRKGSASPIWFVVSAFLSKGLKKVMCILDSSPLWLNPRYDAVVTFSELFRR